jgi:hypothetical protein
MTDEDFLRWLQSRIGYVFRKYDLLQTTLITPGFEGSKVGSEEEEKRYEGNRALAQLGDSLIPLVVRYQVLFLDGASRGMLWAAIFIVFAVLTSEEAVQIMHQQPLLAGNIKWKEQNFSESKPT